MMNKSFLVDIFSQHQQCKHCPGKEDITSYFEELLGLLFPDYANLPIQHLSELENLFERSKKRLSSLIGDDESDKEVVRHFYENLPQVYDQLQEDIEAIYSGDPASISQEEVIRAYPGFYAMAAYRIAHSLLKIGIKLIPRTITENAHSKTGIDIHPGATIGRRCCIDHGTGVVIGETTVIGDDVKIYQGVTLGALSVEKSLANTKRHPTIGDRVVIYSGATVLGGKTIIGDDSIIGGNVWLTESVPPSTQVVYKAPNIHKMKQYN